MSISTNLCYNVAVIEFQYKYALIKCGIAIVATFSHYYIVITNVYTLIKAYEVQTVGLLRSKEEHHSPIWLY
jgi:hypothetical protein